MQDRYLFEYAVIRVVPKVEREEFMNVGVILYCAKHKYLKMKYSIDGKRLRALSKELDIEELERNLLSFKRICEGDAKGGPIAKLDAPSRFRWLTATRSTVVQTSKVHPGLCVDGEDTLVRLFNEQVK
ncbi:DUF3037 domain-containing protein [Mucilaginibacter segetis]|uniref:DUF3037 domain-containing protein n=1 Tax=Mucilaginibacter segetis TaxID=2793071 RepID=A0A934PRX2_9SPHI|nr:DUF3037 domain-containing protein [Mucilaginibacter segetis]MBK0378101.1 DUF3037 domain-containing protein [Mucilaginibacter segetis]